MKYNYIGDTYLIELIIQKKWDYFDIKDKNYIDGTTSKKPPDFDLHLALCLLQKENLPPELLESVAQWVKDNKMLEV